MYSRRELCASRNIRSRRVFVWVSWHFSPRLLTFYGSRVIMRGLNSQVLDTFISIYKHLESIRPGIYKHLESIITPILNYYSLLILNNNQLIENVTKHTNILINIFF